MKTKRRFGRSFILIDRGSANAMQQMGTDVYFWALCVSKIYRSTGVGNAYEYMAELANIPVPIDFQNTQEDNGSCQ